MRRRSIEDGAAGGGKRLHLDSLNKEKGEMSDEEVENPFLKKTRWSILASDGYYVQGFDSLEYDAGTEFFLCISEDGTILISDIATHDSSTIRIYLVQHKQPKITKILIKKITMKDTYFVRGTIKGNLVYLITRKGDIMTYDMKIKETKVLGKYMQIINHDYPRMFKVLNDGKIIASTGTKLFVIGVDGVLRQTKIDATSFYTCIAGNYFYQKLYGEAGCSVNRISLDDFSSSDYIELGYDQQFTVDTVTEQIYVFSPEEKTFELDGGSDEQEHSFDFEMDEQSKIIVSNGNIAVFTPEADDLSISSGRNDVYTTVSIPDSEEWIVHQFITV
jgi:hypothetical protein